MADSREQLKTVGDLAESMQAQADELQQLLTAGQIGLMEELMSDAYQDRNVEGAGAALHVLGVLWEEGENLRGFRERYPADGEYPLSELMDEEEINELSGQGALGYMLNRLGMNLVEREDGSGYMIARAVDYEDQEGEVEAEFGEELVEAEMEDWPEGVSDLVGTFATRFGRNSIRGTRGLEIWMPEAELGQFVLPGRGDSISEASQTVFVRKVRDELYPDGVAQTGSMLGVGNKVANMLPLEAAGDILARMGSEDVDRLDWDRVEGYSDEVYGQGDGSELLERAASQLEEVDGQADREGGGEEEVDVGGVDEERQRAIEMWLDGHSRELAAGGLVVAASEIREVTRLRDRAPHAFSQLMSVVDRKYKRRDVEKEDWKGLRPNSLLISRYEAGEFLTRHEDLVLWEEVRTEEVEVGEIEEVSAGAVEHEESIDDGEEAEARDYEEMEVPDYIRAWIDENSVATREGGRLVAVARISGDVSGYRDHGSAVASVNSAIRLRKFQRHGVGEIEDAVVVKEGYNSRNTFLSVEDAAELMVNLDENEHLEEVKAKYGGGEDDGDSDGQGEKVWTEIGVEDEIEQQSLEEELGELFERLEIGSDARVVAEMIEDEVVEPTGLARYVDLRVLVNSGLLQGENVMSWLMETVQGQGMNLESGAVLGVSAEEREFMATTEQVARLIKILETSQVVPLETEDGPGGQELEVVAVVEEPEEVEVKEADEAADGHEEGGEEAEFPGEIELSEQVVDWLLDEGLDGVGDGNRRHVQYIEMLGLVKIGPGQGKSDQYRILTRVMKELGLSSVDGGHRSLEGLETRRDAGYLSRRTAKTLIERLGIEGLDLNRFEKRLAHMGLGGGDEAEVGGVEIEHGHAVVRIAGETGEVEEVELEGLLQEQYLGTNNWSREELDWLIEKLGVGTIQGEGREDLVSVEYITSELVDMSSGLGAVAWPRLKAQLEAQTVQDLQVTGFDQKTELVRVSKLVEALAGMKKNKLNFFRNG